jgi:pimeloyl-ACP methyl ester carboxylesterase
VTRRGRRAAGVVLLAAAVLGLLLFWPAEPPGPTGGWLQAAGLAPRYTVVDGIKIRYVRTGRGPTVVLLHGFASSIVTWKDVLPQLARRHDVIAIDLPGFGGSDIPARLTPDLLARVIPAVIDRLGVTRTSVVGHSLGGALAVALAAQAPDRVERVVLLDAAGFNFAARDRPALLRLLSVLPGARLLERSPRRRALVVLGLRQVFHDDGLVTRDRIDEYLVPMLRPGSVVAVKGLLQAENALGFPDIVSRVGQPTLVIWGRDDTWIPVSDAHRFGSTLPRAEVVVLDGCGHMPQEERPQETARLLADFLHSPIPALYLAP